MPKSQSSDIPVGTQFSPNLLDLKEFISAVVRYSGDSVAMQIAIWGPPVHLTKNAVPSSSRRSQLPLEAAVQYGLIKPRSYEATDLSRRLNSVPKEDLHDKFAVHILRNLGGLRVVEGAQQMQSDLDAGLSSIRITGDSLAQFLSDQGFRVTVHNTAINSIRMWLAKAGVFSDHGWGVDADKKQELLGLDDAQSVALAGLSPSQIEFVLALCKIEPSGWYSAADVRDLAESTAGVKFGRASLPKEIAPIEDAGFIEVDRGGTQRGKPALVRTTMTFKKEVLEPFLKTTIKHLDPVMTKYYTRRSEDIFKDLGSTDTYVKGEALEAFAIHIMRLLGLRLVGWRKRSLDTAGQTEVDVLMSGMFGGLPALLQVQCKNTPSSNVDLEDIAKEVGIAQLTKATHLLFIANASVPKDAKIYADAISVQTSLPVIVLDNDDFQSIVNSPGRLGSIIAQRSESIVRAKSEFHVTGIVIK
jgi:hypothetical protein